MTDVATGGISATTVGGNPSGSGENGDDGKDSIKIGRVDGSKSGDNKPTDGDKFYDSSGAHTALYNGLFYNGSGQGR